MRHTFLQAAQEYPDIQFCHATGYSGSKYADFPTCTTTSMHIYEARYVSGVVAGMKLNEMIERRHILQKITARMGYVGAFPYAEVISGYHIFLS